MTFLASDFPLYALLLDLQEPGIDRATAEFEQAQKGSFEDRYLFALGIQTIPVNPGWENIPGATQEIMDATLTRCLEIFKEGAAMGHVGSIYMARSYRERGIG